jgi:hypothetical protein
VREKFQTGRAVTLYYEGRGKVLNKFIRSFCKTPPVKRGNALTKELKKKATEKKRLQTAPDRSKKRLNLFTA